MYPSLHGFTLCLADPKRVCIETKNHAAMSSPLYHHVKNVDIDEDREYPWVDRQKETDEKTDDTDDSNNNNLDSSDSTAATRQQHFWAITLFSVCTILLFADQNLMSPNLTASM